MSNKYNTDKSRNQNRHFGGRNDGQQRNIDADERNRGLEYADGDNNRSRGRGRGNDNCGNRGRAANRGQGVFRGRGTSRGQSEHRAHNFDQEHRGSNERPRNEFSALNNKNVQNQVENSKNNWRRNFNNLDQTSYQKHENVNNFFQTKTLLKEMVTEEYKENISLKLLDSKVQIIKFLNNTDQQDLEVVELIMKVTLKASQNTLMEQNFREYLIILVKSNFATKRLDRLISVELHQNFNAEMLRLLISFLKLLFETIPGNSYEFLYARVHNMCMLTDNLRLKSAGIDDNMLMEMEELTLLAETSYPFQKNENPGKKGRVIRDDTLEPPDDYRQISIFPNSQDLIEIGSKDVFLRKNKERGVYKSVDDYLDVQFRLMREDFIQPLREGLQHLHDKGKKRHEIRVYRRIYVLNSLPADRMGIIYNIKFDLSKLKKVKWLQSKRFLYGSLLCLSNDDFKTLLFATVANREIKDLEQGIISVKFHDSIPSKDAEYTMLETTNMFESYRHVLAKLQETNKGNLCFQKYLVFAEEKITVPGYLSRNNGMMYSFSGFTFYPGIQLSNWPRAVDFELDESQYQAFKSALTKEISIIQGPPGTGKTYIGLKICYCLLQNVQQQILRFGPILIVCYTNHALDQFLEGISKFTSKIIRIGNRSKSELLQNYSLLNWKKKTNNSDTFQRRRAIYGKMRDLKDDLIQLQASLKMSYDSIISLDRLRCCISDEQSNYLKSVGIRNWLNGDSANQEFSTLELTLDNIVEWIIYEHMMENLNHTIIEAQVELVNDVQDEYEADIDTEVNFINNHRRLDIDEDDINNLNVEFENVIGRLRAVTFDEDILPTIDNDGFTEVRKKVTKQLFQKRLRSQNKMTYDEASVIPRLDRVNLNDRWKLYRYWRSVYIESLDQRSRSLETEYESLSKQLGEISFEEDRRVMITQDIIGMTTTGAARYGRVLSQIQCKIIIVEEAAEVLESHIIGSLNPGCEHLILIGDHKQLKPNPTVYDLAKTYQLDLSMFERLINNNLHYNTLELQHRMRPEIAEIMRFIYKNLKNHDSVLEYPNVPAVSTNIFFIDHTEPESHNDEISSYSNQFEAQFVVNFCKHLMKNGVENSKITILTLYSGQLFLLRSMMPKQIFEGVRVCVVDNYQGEENEIILLSLVRSNEIEKIGFLSIENRICVCLSRAKYGLFVFGNFQILANQNQLWKEICQDLRKKQRLSDTLVLLCQNHPEKRLAVKYPDDFSKYPEGGCDKLCEQRLVCGHACRKSCHFMDKNHQKVKCIEKCTKLCPNGHRCDLKCWQTCRDCMVSVLKLIPNCGHQQMIECSKTPAPNFCWNICSRKLPCGHECIRKCRDRCGECLKMVTKVSPECGHEGEYKCSDQVMDCTKKCLALLDCDHVCEGTCGSCSSGRLHLRCGNKCKNQLICGHLCKVRCSSDCPPCNEKCEEGCSHNVCPRKCGDECVPCYENCRWKCKHKSCTKKCHEECNRAVCDEMCEKMSDCTKPKCGKRFQCYGVCGEPCRKICLRCDPEVKEIFFGTEDNVDARFITLWTCGHSFECESMDRFMETTPDNGEIVQKRCPRCNTVINKRSCFRYLNIVRKISKDIKIVQGRFRENEEKTDFLKFIKKVEIYSPKITSMFETHKVDNYINRINRESEPLSNYETTKYNTCLDMVYNIYNVLFRKFTNLNKILDIDYGYIDNALVRLLRWLNPGKRKFSSFEIAQFNAEFTRIELIIKLTEARKTQSFLKELPDFIDDLKHCKDFSGQFATDFLRKWKDYEGYLPNMAISEKERKEIVAAIGLSKGRWFKCPNGHYYVIGECGGANQVSRCADCDALVGGQQHRVLADNEFAPEIDLAEHQAFSDQANLAFLHEFL